MELKDAMNKRRSIRKYQKKEVSDAMIETLIEAAIQAPTFVKDRSGFEKSGEPSNELGNGWGCYDLGLQTMNLLLAAT